MSVNHKRPNYTKEFKEEAINLVLKHDYTCHEAGRRLGVAPSSVIGWARLQNREEKETAETGRKILLAKALFLW
jgi:transposase-like protein